MDVWLEIRRNGESGAKLLVSEYGDRLFAAAMLLCGDAGDAEDLVFRTLDRAVRKIDSYRPTGSFFAWLYSILLNFRRMDARRRRPATISSDIVDSIPAPPDATAGASPGATADRAAVRDAVLRLPPEFRETVVLRLFEGLDVDEVAAIQRVPAGTVKSRLHRAKELLRADLLDSDFNKGDSV